MSNLNAIRGATTIENNMTEDIKKASIELINEIILKNNLQKDDIIVMLFSCTSDITKGYPGKYVREYFNLKHVSIMHFNEMNVENNLCLCIRVLVLIKSDIENIKFVYLNGAASLRKDLANQDKDL